MDNNEEAIGSDIARGSLEKYYDYCREITRKASTTFFIGSLLMPKMYRKHVWSVYAFCRVCDDIADNREHVDDPRNQLEIMREMVILINFDTSDGCEDIFNRLDLNNSGGYDFRAIYFTLVDTLRTFNHLDYSLFLGLIDGVCSDLDFFVYESKSDLDDYCNKVAGGVGVMIAQMLGVGDQNILEKARMMGNAMQITNILRDIGEDYWKGRVYIPEYVLVKHGIDLNIVDSNFKKGVKEGQYYDRYVGMMKEYISENRYTYMIARKALSVFGARVRLPLLTASLMYEDILTSIEKNNYDVFTKRAFISNKRKLQILLRAVVLTFCPMLH